MSRTEKTEFTNMCMVYDGDRVLVQDKISKSWGGIMLPGGHVEPYEDFTDAVIREVYEETGLTISSPRLCGIKDWYKDDGSRYVVLLYKTEKFSGELKSSDEGEVFWVTFNELKTMSIADGMDKMLEVFLNDDISEMCYHKVNDEWITVLK
ncbi:MAG: 8-oxo-dGTP diphosphatase [Ruminiclostridium sp.]|nr:8-oxo-dGTP diphosphatase [Ruminiclostridium sp.]